MILDEVSQQLREESENTILTLARMSGYVARLAKELAKAPQRKVWIAVGCSRFFEGIKARFKAAKA